MAHLTLMHKQQGVVLIVALIMVIAITGIAVTLMSSSSVDIKITNAAQEREAAENELIGDVQNVIANEAKKLGNSRFFFSRGQVPETGLDLGNTNDTSNTMFNKNEGPLALRCPRRFDDTAGLRCNMVEINSVIEYGSKSKHNLTITTGIAQEMLSLNSGN
ncbi:pilus assembly protein PilX [Pseudoalteromonas sp. Hal040]|uniref:pilus assembly PilX family protein n=2 Tax=Pseudoalteromonas TaxID=53246 RepID=UPI001D770E72|nr:pilus assembly protein PilX [Pseudoalteromonas sp.]NRA76661.1 pilus assembly protein PilX [Pseudoalteromonas sp.]